MFIEPKTTRPALRQEGHVYRTPKTTGPALRQEGHVYRTRRRPGPPSARRAMFIEPEDDQARPPSGGQCL